MTRSVLLFVAAIALFGCKKTTTQPTDDAGTTQDASSHDGSTSDANAGDDAQIIPDASTTDSEVNDAGVDDATVIDSATTDSSVADASSDDASAVDGSSSDDAAVIDSAVDAGPPVDMGDLLPDMTVIPIDMALPTCAMDQMFCAGACRLTNEDPAFCGSCMNRCGDSQACVSGVCTDIVGDCSMNSALCTGRMHCDTSGITGVCVPGCATGLVYVSGSCIALTGLDSLAYAKASNTESGDAFGGVLAMSGDGATLAIGAEYEDSWATGVDGLQSDNEATNSGAVYVFHRTESTWSQEAYIKASNTGAHDGFGGSLALSYDGSVLAVGAYAEDSAARGVGGNQMSEAGPDSGAVYVFRRGSMWSQEAYIKASNTGIGDWFGASLSLSSDGTVLAVGAPREDSAATGVNGDSDSNAANDSGAVYVFHNTASVWSQEAYLKASNTDAGDFFGYATQLSADGATLVAGAPYEDGALTGIDMNAASNTVSNSGAAYVFARGTTAWSQTAYAKSSNTDFDQHFGISVAVSFDGTTFAVGATGEATSATGVNGTAPNPYVYTDSGAVYIFRKHNDLDGWAQEAYVKASNTGPHDQFGYALSLSAAGDVLYVGAAEESSNALGIGGNQNDNSAASAGAVYVLRRYEALWSQEAMGYVKATNTEAGDLFGVSVAASANGVLLAVGASYEDSAATGLGGSQSDNSALDSGAVYLYSR